MLGMTSGHRAERLDRQVHEIGTGSTVNVNIHKARCVAMDSRGKETKGVLEVANQNEAVGRLKEMGFFPTKVVEAAEKKEKGDAKGRPGPKGAAGGKKKGMEISRPPPASCRNR